MTRRQTQNILKTFDSEEPLYETWAKKLELLVREILETNKLSVHSVSGRTKNRKSLEKKIESKSRGYYTNLEDITDVVGVRVITYFADDVDRVAESIKQEFAIDVSASIDKRGQLDPEAFGYLSVHYIISLNDNRERLPEYKRLMGLKAEIQIRSVLQHAWAEIEHDLGYKTEGAIPRSVRRRFSRLAGLLELGDDEFIHIRNQLNEYTIDVTKNIVEAPQLVEIDKISLISFIKTKFCEEIDLEIAKATNHVIIPMEDDENYDDTIAGNAEFILPRLKFLNISTIEKLETQLTKFRPLLAPFVIEWLKYTEKTEQPISDIVPMHEDGDELPNGQFMAGICMFYLTVVGIAGTNNPDEMKRYWQHFLGDNVKAEKHAEMMASTFSKVLAAHVE